MASLRIYMLDLMGFAYRNSGMWAVLPDARAKSAHFVHHPIVLFDIPPQGDGQWKMIAKKLMLDPDHGNHAWLLDQEDIVIPHQNTASPLSFVNSPVAGYPDSSNAGFFSWVPRMDRVFSRCRDMETGLTPPDYKQRLPTSAAARMLLTQGSLETATFVKFYETGLAPEVVLLTFPNSDVTQALAEILVATVPMDGNEITISTFDHKSGKPGREVTLTQKGGYADMLVANLSPLQAGVEQGGRHFQLYYGLSTEPGQVGPSPQAVRHEKRDNVEKYYPSFIDMVKEAKKGGESRPICTFVQFS